MDSNHDKSLQRALCYRYTIGHAQIKLTVPTPTANPKSRRPLARIDEIIRGILVEFG
jgi:hypothetical protein